MPTLPKELLAKYDVLAELRGGGMGAVFKVRHRYLDEVQVIKVMHSPLRTSEDLRTRFVREARTAKQLRHPGIAEVVDFCFTADGTAYIVMEFIDGVDLRDVLTRAGKPLEWPFVAEIALQTLAILEFLHGRGFVHRDISPDNLMIARRPDGAPQIKLIDLGIAKAVQEDTAPLTSAGAFLGKLQYASPEQFLAADAGAKLDGRSDLYSLGVVMYELLTDMEPIVGADAGAIRSGHLNGAARGFATADPRGLVPEWMRSVVMKAMHKERVNRYQNAAEFAAAIRAGMAAAGEPSRAMAFPPEEPVPAAAVRAGAARRRDALNGLWEGILQTGDFAALEAIITNYPRSPYAARARQLLNRFQSEERD